MDADPSNLNLARLYLLSGLNTKDKFSREDNFAPSVISTFQGVIFNINFCDICIKLLWQSFFLFLSSDNLQNIKSSEKFINIINMF